MWGVPGSLYEPIRKGPVTAIVVDPLPETEGVASPEPDRLVRAGEGHRVRAVANGVDDRRAAVRVAAGQGLAADRGSSAHRGDGDRGGCRARRARQILHSRHDVVRGARAVEDVKNDDVTRW